MPTNANLREAALRALDRTDRSRTYPAILDRTARSRTGPVARPEIYNVDAMCTRDSRRGNSLAIRIPKSSLKAAGLSEGDVLTIRSGRDRLVLRRSNGIDIEELIESTSAATLPDESLDFPPVGRESL